MARQIHRLTSTAILTAALTAMLAPAALSKPQVEPIGGGGEGFSAPIVIESSSSGVELWSAGLGAASMLLLVLLAAGLAAVRRQRAARFGQGGRVAMPGR